MHTLKDSSCQSRFLPQPQPAGPVLRDVFSFPGFAATIDRAIALGFAGLAVGGLGALIYGFYSTCQLYYVKASIFFSAAVTSLN